MIVLHESVQECDLFKQKIKNICKVNISLHDSDIPDVLDLSEAAAWECEKTFNRGSVGVQSWALPVLKKIPKHAETCVAIWRSKHSPESPGKQRSRDRNIEQGRLCNGYIS